MTKTKMVSYSLRLPENVYSEVRSIANKEGSSAKEILNLAVKDFIKKYKEVI